MIIASGFLDIASEEDIKNITEELSLRGVEVNEIQDRRIVFLIERETTRELKESLESLKDIDGVGGVYLAYYSLEGADEA